MTHAVASCVAKRAQNDSKDRYSSEPMQAACLFGVLLPFCRNLALGRKLGGSVPTNIEEDVLQNQPEASKVGAYIRDLLRPHVEHALRLQAAQQAIEAELQTRPVVAEKPLGGVQQKMSAGFLCTLAHTCKGAHKDQFDGMLRDIEHLVTNTTQWLGCQAAQIMGVFEAAPQDGAWDIAAMGALLLKPVTLAFAAAVKAGQSVLNEAASLEKTTGCTSLKPSCAALEEEP